MTQIQNKLHPNVLAQKIIDLVNNLEAEKASKFGINAFLTKELLLKAIPELYAPMAMADQLVLNYEDARMALDEEWDRSDPGFTTIKDTCSSLYEEWTGIPIKDAVEELYFEEDPNTATVEEL